jgi:hypothetical protein
MRWVAIVVVAVTVLVVPHRASAALDPLTVYAAIYNLAREAGRGNNPAVYEAIDAALVGVRQRHFGLDSVADLADLVNITEGYPGISYISNAWATHDEFRYMPVYFRDGPKSKLDYLLANMAARGGMEEAHHWASSNLGSRVLLQKRFGLSKYLKYLAYTGRQYDPEGAIAAFFLKRKFPYTRREIRRYTARTEFLQWLREGSPMTNPALAAAGRGEKVGIDLGLRNIRLGGKTGASTAVPSASNIGGIVRTGGRVISLAAWLAAVTELGAAAYEEYGNDAPIKGRFERVVSDIVLPFGIGGDWESNSGSFTLPPPLPPLPQDPVPDYIMRIHKIPPSQRTPERIRQVMRASARELP